MNNEIIIETDICSIAIAWDDLDNEIKKLTEAGKVYVKIQGEMLGFEVPPVIENGRTLVPLRFIFEKMVAKVDWDPNTATATVTDQGKSVSFSIDNKIATVDGIQKEMDTPARLINGKTMIPLRFISEQLGYKVEWDVATSTATISR
ncbi:MAG: copper amine oxidase N-terminal domain-containing protein [Clostridiaceae bacterium]|nr:copper amine oxidase N-terminal domain-containing protein [Clostridiaceae bacterium]